MLPFQHKTSWIIRAQVWCYNVGTKTESCALTYSILLWGVLGVFEKVLRWFKKVLVLILQAPYELLMSSLQAPYKLQRGSKEVPKRLAAEANHRASSHCSSEGAPLQGPFKGSPLQGPFQAAPLQGHLNFRVLSKQLLFGVLSKELLFWLP